MTTAIDLYYRLTIEDYRGIFPGLAENELVMKFPEQIQLAWLEARGNILTTENTYFREGNVVEKSKLLRVQLDKISLSIRKLSECQEELQKDIANQAATTD